MPILLQRGAITPVPGPTFTDNQQASPAAAATATAGNMSRAPSPMGRPGQAAATGGNPFARKPVVEQPENSPGNAAAAAAAKRKAPASGNPFARRSKAAKA